LRGEKSRSAHPRIAVVGSLLIIVVAGAVAVLTSRTADWTPATLVVVLAVFYIPSELLAVQSKRPGAAPWATTSSAPLILAMTLAGPAPAAALSIVGLTLADAQQHSSKLARVTNYANFAAFTVAGGLIARWIGEAGGITPADPAFVLLFLGIYAFSNVGSFSINLLSGRLAWGDSIRGQYERERMWVGADGVAALLATATAYAYGTVGLGALGLLVIVQLTFQYLASNLSISRDREEALERRAEELSRLNVTLADLSASRGRLVGQVLAAEETERRRLAESLHSEALQDLVFAQGLAASQSRKSEQLTAAIGRAVDQLRSAIFDLHPAVLKHAGLEAALKEVAGQQSERAGFRSEVSIDPEACGPNDQLLFALGREQLTNAAKHAGASEVSLSIARQNGSLLMQVADDGCGMDDRRRKAAVEQGHIGLASSIERVEALGGSLEIASELGGGTRVLTRLPVTSAGDDAED
jgi:signal transduction histidine kinase